jgi:hypothetical protein
MTTSTRSETRGTPFVSLAVAAEEFGNSVKRIRRRISDGTVHGYPVGRRIRVDLEEHSRRMLVEIPMRKRLEP